MSRIEAILRYQRKLVTSEEDPEDDLMMVAAVSTGTGLDGYPRGGQPPLEEYFG